MVDERLLGIYLNDHLAGATLGSQLAGRICGRNDDEPGEALRVLRDEIEADRQTLLGLMSRLGVRPDCLKQAGGWLMEKLGRAKLNGQLTGSSPLSAVVEFEGLAIGVEGKHALWRTLRSLVSEDPRLGSTDFDVLIERALRQREQLEELRQRAVEQAFTR